MSFLFSFGMAFLILVTTLYAFGKVNDAARVLSAQAELNDVATRVSLGIQESLAVAAARNDSRPEAKTDQLRYERTIAVPYQVQGFDYNVTLDPNFVNATLKQRNYAGRATTFNASALLPVDWQIDANCTAAFVVCKLEGTVRGNLGRIIITYQFNSSATPPDPVTNKITIR